MKMLKNAPYAMVAFTLAVYFSLTVILPLASGIPEI